MTCVIARPCVDVKDRACIDERPVDCIYEGARSLYVHPGGYIDCGICGPVCPTETTFYEDDLPSEWSDYLCANVDFFNDLSSPGGAQKIGVQSFDDSMIATLPPQNEEWKAENL